MKNKIMAMVMACLMVVSVCSSVFADAAPDYYSIIYREVLNTSPGLGEDGADWVAKAIIYSCNRWGVDPILVAAVFKEESGYNMESVSPVGAVGIAQLMPETAEGLGVDPYNALENVDGGVHYLKLQLDRFANKGAWSATYAVAAYNAGPAAVEKYNGVPPYDETINYVNSINGIYREIIN